MNPSTPTIAAEAWAELAAGNVRFATDVAHRALADSQHRRSISRAQAPFAAVLGCSDSRVAAELVFDRGLGEVFVVRTAGHVVDTAVLGSIEFAVSALGVPLLVVLGHDSCGAVAAAMRSRRDGNEAGGYMRDLVERVITSVLSAEHRGLTEVDDVEREHVQVTAMELIERSDVIRSAVSDGRLGVVGVYYSLAEGLVEPCWSRGVPGLDLTGPAASGVVEA